MLLQGKVAVVTGSGRGVGRGIALALAREGARVVINDVGCEVDGRGTAQDPATQVVNEIKALGRVDSAVRTPEQTDTALFHFEAPAFTLGNATRAAVASHPLRLVDSARLFALVNMGMADALIAVWDAKFTYNFWRAVTAIPAAATDGNPNTAADPTWAPLSATPPHPEYPAAHTIVAAAGVEVLAAAGQPGVQRRTGTVRPDPSCGF